MSPTTTIGVGTHGGKGIRQATGGDFTERTRELLRRYPPIGLRSELTAGERGRLMQQSSPQAWSRPERSANS